MRKKEHLVFVRGRWEIATLEINAVTKRGQWERRDGSYICDVGDEVATATMPHKPSKETS